MTRRALYLWGLLWSIGVLALVALGADTRALSDLADLRPAWVLAGFGVYMVNYLLRTWRFRLLLGTHRVPWARLLGIVQVYGALNYLLPARAGEVSFPILIKRFNRTEYSLGTASVIAARVLDIAALVLLLPVALAVSADRLPAWAVPAAATFGVTVALAGGLVVIAFRRPAGTSRAKVGSPTTVRRRLLGFVAATLAHLREGLAPRAWPRLLLASVAIWLCIAMNFHLILRAMGVQTTFFAAFAITLVMLPLSLLPVQGFANLGTHEAAWIAILVLFGFGVGQANAVALLSHAVLLVYVLVLGGAGGLLIALGDARCRWTRKTG